MGNNKNNMKKIKRALISVWNKNNLVNLLNCLKKHKIEIISSGGTYKKIKNLGFKCIEVSKFTGSPEILGGRVKTLHPKIHAGILNKRSSKNHVIDLKKNNFQEIDLVIVNFYPFEEILNKTKNKKIILENIDIGGPALVRAAAKNYNDVITITNPQQYIKLKKELKKYKGSTSLTFREKMASDAFMETSYYDSLITNYFNKITKEIFPKKKIMHGSLVEKLRYGENPHQKSAIYSINKKLNIIKLNGKQLSYNNYNDIYAALLISKSLPKNVGTVIVKHSNPCGVSINKNPIKSYKLALACDPVSAFGGVVSCNFKIKHKLANELNKLFLEVIVANGFENKALKILKKRKNLRLINCNNLNLTDKRHYLFFGSSFLAQDFNNKFLNDKLKIVTKRKPTPSQLNALKFTFNICKFVKSNAIVLSSGRSTIGIGAGQPSRLDSCKIASQKALKFVPEKIINSVAASDAFFPFADGIEELARIGVKAIIQPGGSINDKKVIRAANKADISMVFTGIRHFKH